ncbi:hypothetical protein EMIT0P395_10208 [Pseudomonas sp. IT-P395]
MLLGPCVWRAVLSRLPNCQLQWQRKRNTCSCKSILCARHASPPANRQLVKPTATHPSHLFPSVKNDPVSILPRQHFQQLNLKHQIRIRRDLAHRPLAIAQMRRHQQFSLAPHLHAHQALIPTLDHPPGANHALKRFATAVGRIELAAVFQPTRVLGGDQRAFDGGFAFADLKIDYLQFIIHNIHFIVQPAAVFPEMPGIGNLPAQINMYPNRVLKH